jgi:hypothetical protein
MVREAIEAEVRSKRPDLTEGHYLYVVREVYQLLCHDTEDALLEQPPDRWTPSLIEFHFVRKVSTYLTKLEIRTGQMVLYERSDDWGES